MIAAITQIDTSILFFIAEHFRTDFLDALMQAMSQIGDRGVVWILLGVFLIARDKTRPAGVALLLALLCAHLLGNEVLKPLFDRPRPCDIYPGELHLISRPGGSSFPSGHTITAFASAVALAVFRHRQGALALILAALIALSRIYLFVHWPSDVLAGAVLGGAIGLAAAGLVKLVLRRRAARRPEKPADAPPPPAET